MPNFETLLAEVRACRICADQLPLPPRPLLQALPSARILIVGQAPGQRAHDSGRPFSDASGDRLRAWTGLSPEVFYDASRVALVPMGFCFPGAGTSGDLPPRPECAAAWRRRLLAGLRKVELTLVIGSHARAWHLPDAPGSLTDTVAAWRGYLPKLLPLPHPSPRNNLWLKRNPWFERELLPVLRQRVAEVLG